MAAAVLFASASAGQPVTQPLAFNAPAAQERALPAGALRLAVPEFADNGSAEELQFLRDGLPILLRVALLSQPAIVFVDGTAPTGGSLSPEDARAQGADFLLQGSYFYYQGSIRLDAEVRELSGGAEASISSGVVALEDLYKAVDELAADLRTNLPELRRGSGARRIAVACFANATEPAAEQQAWIGNSLGKFLSTHLLAGEDMTVLPWDEAKQGCSRDGAARRPGAVLADLGADALLTGQFKITGEEVSVYPELVLTRREGRLPFPVVAASASRLGDIEDLVAEDAQALLGTLLVGRTWRLEPFAEEVGVEAAAERATALLQRNEELPLALWLFQRIKELAPGDPRGYAGVGAYRLASGRYGQALRELSRAAQLAPERADFQKLLGDAYLKLNRVEDAVGAYSRATVRAPDTAEYSLKLGIALQLKGDYPQALEAMTAALQKGAPPAEVHVAMANVHRSAGDVKSAAAQYRQALATEPSSREARLGLSEVLVAQTTTAISSRNYSAALELLREAQSLSPSTNGYARLALVLTDTYQYEEAVRVSEEAERAELVNAQLLVSRAFALSRLGRREDALKVYDSAHQLEPENATILLTKANLLTQMNRQSEARELLATIHPDKTNLETRIRIATVLARLEDYPTALAEIDSVLKIDPKSSFALNAQAYILNRTGHFKDALDVLNEGIRLNPNNESLHTNRAYALEELGRYEDAIAAADRAIEVNSRAAAARSHKGYSLYQLGKTEEGLQLIQEAAAIDPGYGGSHYNLARVRVREGRIEEALAELAIACDLDPRFRTLALESPEFEPLRLDPSFQGLLARFQPPGTAK